MRHLSEDGQTKRLPRKKYGLGIDIKTMGTGSKSD
jgi:hypothetical protein